MALFEQVAEASTSKAGYKRSPLVREESELEEDTWGYRAKEKDGANEDAAGNGYAEVDELLRPSAWKSNPGPSLRRGWSQLPEERDHVPTEEQLDGDARPKPRGPRPQPSGTGEWEEVPITTPELPSSEPNAPTGSESKDDLQDYPSTLYHTAQSSTRDRPTITSWASSVSTARRIPPPERLETSDLLPDGDRASRLKRPAIISWTSEPYLPVAMRFQRKDDWDGPY